MCPGVARTAPGDCPRCRMALAGTPTVGLLRCPRHPTDFFPPVSGPFPSPACEHCGRPLVPVTVSHTFRCPEHPALLFAEAGTCSECGGPLDERFEELPHGDHNPRHGGILFMAPDQWHHLEGTWPEGGVFRIYFYDDFTRPMAADRFSARAVAGENESGPAVKLEPAGGGAYLEGKLNPPPSPPLHLTAFIAFGGKEERFDFVFSGFSREPGMSERAPTENARPSPATPQPVPDSPEEIAAAIAGCNLRLRALIATGAWSRLYLPALEAKDLALVLEEKTTSWDENRRREIARAARDIVRGAWLLDQAGDRGDAARVKEEYAVFAAGVARLRGLFRFLDE